MTLPSFALEQWLKSPVIPGDPSTDDEPRPPPRPAAADTPFSSGVLLDTLPRRGLDVRVSCCEALGAWLGVEDPKVEELNVRHQALLNLCKELPARVDGSQPMDIQLGRFGQNVGEFSRKTIQPWSRDADIERLGRLCEDARVLRRHLEDTRRLLLRHQQSRALNPAGTPELGHFLPAAYASLDTVSEPSTLDGSSARLRFVPRRRDRAELARQPVPMLQPDAPPRFVLDAQAQRDIEAAVAAAYAEAGGRERLRGAAVLVLGRRLSAVVHGTFADRLLHKRDGRAHDRSITEVIEDATRHMTADRRDAVNAHARRHLAQLRRA